MTVKITSNARPNVTVALDVNEATVFQLRASEHGTVAVLSFGEYSLLNPNHVYGSAYTDCMLGTRFELEVGKPPARFAVDKLRGRSASLSDSEFVQKWYYDLDREISRQLREMRGA